MIHDVISKSCLQLGSRCKDLRDVHFGQCYKISDEGMVVIARGCPKLQRIYMQENKLVSTFYILSINPYVVFSIQILNVWAVLKHNKIHITTNNIATVPLAVYFFGTW